LRRRNEARDGTVPIAHLDLGPALDRSQVLGEAILELGDLDASHGQI
jgi:hypothetical protein